MRSYSPVDSAGWFYQILAYEADMRSIANSKEKRDKQRKEREEKWKLNPEMYELDLEALSPDAIAPTLPPDLLGNV